MLINNNIKIKYKNYKPKNYKKFKVGILGAGNIVENSHLPIYTKENLNIVNIFDIDLSKSKKLKKKFNIDKFSTNLDEFLNDKNIDIVDIAVPAKFNKNLFLKTLKKGKNILIQKPLANNLKNASDILKHYNQSILKANVNHQMRYSPSIMAAKDILKKKLIGQIKEFNFFTHRFTNWSIWPWLQTIDYPELRYNSIHYLDSIRYLFGNPVNLKAKLISSDNNILNKPTNIKVNFLYESFSGILHITHNSKLESNKWEAGYKIVGDSGECSGTISSMIGNGTDFYDKIKISYLKNKILYKEEHQLNGRWFSESFNGPMFSLMNSINNNTQPETNINDAFETLLLVEKVIRSHKLSE